MQPRCRTLSPNVSLCACVALLHFCLSNNKTPVQRVHRNMFARRAGIVDSFCGSRREDAHRRTIVYSLDIDAQAMSLQQSDFSDGRLQTIRADVSNKSDCEAAVARVLQEQGR